MPLEQAFRFSSVLLAATAAFGLIMARSLPGWLAAVTIMVLLLAGHEVLGRTSRLTIRQTWSQSTLVLNSALIGALVLALIDAVAISLNLLHAGIHFLVVLLCIKLLTLNHDRDYRHLYAICLTAMLASATMTTEIWFLPLFLLYLFSATWTLLLYHLTTGINISLPLIESRPDLALRLHLNSGFVWFANGVVLVALALTIVIFFAIPRFSAGILQKSRGEALKTTGFSERVDLGMIGSLKEDPQIVMRVELSDQSSRLKDLLYLRGVAFDHYNGRSWSASTRSWRTLPHVGGGMYAAGTSGRRMPDNTPAPLRQDILLEALDTSVLFAAPFAEFVISGEISGLQTDKMGGLHLPFPSSTRLRYSVISHEHQVFEEEQHESTPSYSDSILSQYLQLPAISPRIGDLAQHVTAGTISPYEKVAAIYRHLSSEYRYSLDIESTTSARPIEDFLFTRKTGYCEHYATAMVVMLRSLGIPSRLVTGFLATEWNNFGNYYTVRQRDAHAWVEVYYPHSGWVTVDPTPASAIGTSSSSWQVLHRIGDSLRLQWDRFFIRFSGRDQLAVVSRLRDSGDSVRHVFSTWASTLAGAVSPLFANITIHDRWSGYFILGTFVVLLSSSIFLMIKLIPRWRHAPVWNRRSGHTHAQIINLYKKMVRIASQRGIVMHPSTTPLEFVRLVSANWKSGELIVADVTALYCRGRFSRTPLSREELARAREGIVALQHMSQAMR